MPTDFQSVQQFIDRIIDQGRVPAAGIAIAIDGQPVFTYLAGDASPGTPATEATLWPLASISKLYTASAVMSVIEEGRLALWTKTNAILPEFRRGGREEITLRHLLTHTAGLPFAPDTMDELLRARATLEELAAYSFTDPLLFPPGTAQAYNNANYGIAGLMAAKVAGISFPELVRTRLFEPAGLTQTYLILPPDLLPQVARVAGVPGEGTDWAIHSSLYGSQIGHPAYGVMATLSDLLRFLLLFDPNGGGTIHSAAGLRTLTTDQTGGYRREAAAGRIEKWGAGFMLQEGSGVAGIASPESYGHLGGTGCVGWIDPRDGVSVAFVSNSDAELGWDEWRERLEEAVNVAIATATTPD